MLSLLRDGDVVVVGIDDADQWIDPGVRADLDAHYVVEADAFGDLLPNLERDGLSVYEREIRAAEARWASA